MSCRGLVLLNRPGLAPAASAASLGPISFRGDLHSIPVVARRSSGSSALCMTDRELRALSAWRWFNGSKVNDGSQCRYEGEIHVTAPARK